MAGNGTVPDAPAVPDNETKEIPPALNDTALGGEAADSAAGSYAGKDFAALAALYLPLECDAVHTYGGKPVKIKVFMKGPSELRVESPVGLTQCGTTISIVRDGRVYVGCAGKQVFPSCDWLRSDYDLSSPGKAATFDLTLAEMDCRDWEYDVSVFRSQGEVCRL